MHSTDEPTPLDLTGVKPHHPLRILGACTASRSEDNSIAEMPSQKFNLDCSWDQKDNRHIVDLILANHAADDAKAVRCFKTYYKSQRRRYRCIKAQTLDRKREHQKVTSRKERVS